MRQWLSPGASGERPDGVELILLWMRPDPVSTATNHRPHREGRWRPGVVTRLGRGWIDGMWCMPAPSRGLLWQHIAGPWILAVSSPLPGVAGHSWLAVHPPAGVATSATDRPSGESCRRPAPPRPPRNARSRQPPARSGPTQPSCRQKRHLSCRLLSHPRPLPCPRVAIDQATTGGVSRYRYIVREPLAA